MDKKPPRPTVPAINDSSLAHESWKIFQVAAELIEGLERLVSTKPCVSIFGSARTPCGHPYYALTEALGQQLSNAGFSVITGGGPGLMEAGNKGAYQGKSFSIGLNIVLHHQESPNPYQDISLRFRHFFTRKFMFAKYATAFVFVPGGYGTLDELGEILALVQTKKTKMVPIILVNELFWRPLLKWFHENLINDKMIDKSDLALIQVVNTPEEVVSIIQNFYHPKDTASEVSKAS